MALIDLVREAYTMIVPVIPSPTDIHDTSHVIRDLFLVTKVRVHVIGVGVVANRVSKNPRVFQRLLRILDSSGIPMIGYLREIQNSVQPANGGKGVFEWRCSRDEQDR